MTTHDRCDADRLDDWLEGMPGSGTPTSSPYCHEVVGGDLLGVAQKFHVEMQAAESRLSVPASRIWEDIMATTPNVNVPTVSTLPAIGTGDSGSVPPSGGWFRHSGGDHERRGFIYWAVPVGMVALVVFAIVAVSYLANRPDSQLAGITYYPETPGLTANLAASPDASFAVISADEEAWLIDPGLYPCVKMSSNLMASVILGSIDTNSDNYLPFSPATEADGHAVAESYLFNYNNCDPEDVGYTYLSDEIGTFPQEMDGVAVGTADEITLAKRISAEIGNNPLELLIDGPDVTLPVTNTPTSIIGRSRPVVLPRSAITLPDGRIGVPALGLVQTNHPSGAAGLISDQGNYVTTQFLVYTIEDGHAVLEDIISVCIGECESYWTSIQIVGTPVASPPASPNANANAEEISLDPEATYVDPGFWLPPEYPATPEVEDRSLLPHLLPDATPEASPAAEDITQWLIWPEDNPCEKYDGELLPDDAFVNNSDPRIISDYLPFSEANPDQKQAVAQQFKSISGDCDTGDWSPVYSYDLSAFPQLEEGAATPEQLDLAMDISAAVDTGDPLDYIIEDPASANLEPNASWSSSTYGVILPSLVVVLPDGRLGAPISQVVLTDHPDGAAGIVADGGNLLQVNFMIFETQSNGELLIDEIVQTCVGDCDAFWDEYVTSTELASPEAEASPMASPDVAQWLQPISAVDCTAEALSPDDPVFQGSEIPPENENRSYDSVGPADQASAGIVSSVNRTWQSCRLFGRSFAYMSLQSSRIAAEVHILGSSSSFREYPSTHPDALLDLLDPDPMTYFQPRQSDADPSLVGSLWLIDPAHVVQFSDGRLGAPATEILPQWYLDDLVLRDAVPPVVFIFFIESPDDGTRWLLDEFVLLCPEGCIQDSISSHASTTPEAVSEFVPIAAEECDVVGLSIEEVSAIVRDPGEEPDRSYVPVGPADPETAAKAIAADRAWQACKTFGSLGQKSMMQTP